MSDNVSVRSRKRTGSSGSIFADIGVSSSVRVHSTPTTQEVITTTVSSSPTKSVDFVKETNIVETNTSNGELNGTLSTGTSPLGANASGIFSDKADAESFTTQYTAPYSIDESPSNNVEVEDAPIAGIIPQSILSEYSSHVSFVVLAFLVHYFSFSFGWAVSFALIVGFYNIRVLQKLKRQYVNEAKFDVAKRWELQVEHERAEWFNQILSRFWLIYEPVLSETITMSLDPLLEYYCPPILDSLKFSEFSLGARAPRIDSILMSHRAPDDLIDMQLDLSFSPASALTGQKPSKIELKIHLKGPATPNLTISLSDVHLEGVLHVRCKLMTAFPHVKLIELKFVESPELDFVLKPIGKVDIMNLPGLGEAINGVIKNIIDGVLVKEWLKIDLDAIMNATPTEDTATGLLVLSLHEGRDLPSTELLSKADPYCRIYHNGRLVSTTPHIDNTLNPYWDVTKFIPLPKCTGKIMVEVVDHNRVSKDKVLGSCEIDLEEVNGAVAKSAGDANAANGAGTGWEVENVWKKLFVHEKQKGSVRYDLKWYPVNNDGPSDARSGIVRVQIHQAKAIGEGKQRNPYVEVLLNGEKVHRTKVKKRTADPVWEDFTELFVSDFRTAKLHFKIRDIPKLVRDIAQAEDPLLGDLVIPLQQVLQNKDAKNDWFVLSNATEGKIRLTFRWKPIQMDSSVGSSGTGSVLGIAKININNCLDLKNMDRMQGSSDPFVKVVVSGKTRYTSRVMQNNLNPVWNETCYVSVKKASETIIFEVWDKNVTMKDREIGRVEFDLKKCVTTSEDGSIKGTDAVNESLDVMTKGSSKSRGKLNVTVSFHERYTPPALLDYDNECISGILRVNVHQARNLPKKCNSYVEVAIDQEPNKPHFVTKPRKRTSDPIFEESCELFIKEVFYGSLSFSLKEEVGTIDTKSSHELGALHELFVYDIVQNLGKEGWVDIGAAAQLKLSFEFQPVRLELTMNERSENKGHLKLDIVQAYGLPNVDSFGSADPFVVVNLNDEKVHKTKIHKNTINPVFNESVSIQITNRLSSKLILYIFDWNRLQTHELMGSVVIPLDQIEPEKEVEEIYKLIDASSGSIKLKMYFEPGTTRKKKKSTWMSAKHVMSSVSEKARLSFNAPLKTLRSSTFDTITQYATSFNGSTGANGQTTSMIAQEEHAVKSPETMSTIDTESSLETGHVDGQLTRISESKEFLNASSASMDNLNSSNGSIVRRFEQPSDPGSLSITILEAQGLKGVDSGGTSDPYVKVRTSNPTVLSNTKRGGNNNNYLYKTSIQKRNNVNPIWNESFSLQLPPLLASKSDSLNSSDLSLSDVVEQFFLSFVVKDHNLLKDVDIGIVELDVWNLIFARIQALTSSVSFHEVRPGMIQVSEEVTLSLHRPGSGETGRNGRLKVRLEAAVPTIYRTFPFQIYPYLDSLMSSMDSQYFKQNLSSSMSNSVSSSSGFGLRPQKDKDKEKHGGGMNSMMSKIAGSLHDLSKSKSKTTSTSNISLNSHPNPSSHSVSSNAQIPSHSPPDSNSPSLNGDHEPTMSQSNSAELGNQLNSTAASGLKKRPSKISLASFTFGGRDGKEEHDDEDGEGHKDKKKGKKGIRGFLKRDKGDKHQDKETEKEVEL